MNGLKNKGKENRMMNYIQIKKTVRKKLDRINRSFILNLVSLKIGSLNSEKWDAPSSIRVSHPINIP